MESRLLSRGGVGNSEPSRDSPRKSLTENVAANFLATLWTAAITVAVVPLQVNLVGAESFGLIGLVAALQVILSFLDLGLTATISREIARKPSDFLRNRQLVQTAVTISWSLALGVTLIGVVAANWITREWIRDRDLSDHSVATVVRLTALYLGIRWPVASLNATLVGLQRLDLANLLKASFFTIRVVGGTAILAVWPQVTAYLVWFSVSAVIETIVTLLVCRKQLPGLTLLPTLNPQIVSSTRAFTTSVGGVSALSVILTQSDKIFISKLLPLEQLGHYSLAYSLASGLAVIQLGITGAVFPAFVSDYQTDPGALARRYKKSMQLVVLLTALPAFVLMFYGEQLLLYFVAAEVAQAAIRPLRLLSIGFLLNGAAAVGYTLALASEKEREILKLSFFATTLFLPALWFLITRYALAGAAAAWLGLNAYFVLAITLLVETPLVRGDGMARAVFLASLIGFGTFLVGQSFMRGQPTLTLLVASIAISTTLFLCCAWLVVGKNLGMDLLRIVRQRLRRS